jgi:ferredoxin
MMEKKRFVIVKERCSVCGLCADVCPVEAISQFGPYVIDPKKCTGCGICRDDCPSGAIAQVKAPPPGNK